MRTIGILCEGAETDAPVLKMLLEYYFPPDQARFIVQGVSKADIFSNPAPWLSMLFEKGAERALIIWDLLPMGYGMGVPSQWSERPNKAEQRQMLLDILCKTKGLSEKLRLQARHLANRYGFQEEYVDPPYFGDDLFILVCVCYTLEGWLLSDPGVLCSLASTQERNIKRLDPAPEEPDRCISPSQSLSRSFRNVPNKRFRFYNKVTHNRIIAQEYIRQRKVDQMRRSQSFCRVVDSISRWMK